MMRRDTSEKRRYGRGGAGLIEAYLGDLHPAINQRDRPLATSPVVPHHGADETEIRGSQK